jgi:hypothetical protein
VVAVEVRVPVRVVATPSRVSRRRIGRGAPLVAVLAAVGVAAMLVGFALGRQAAFDGARSAFADAVPSLSVAAANDSRAQQAYQTIATQAAALTQDAGRLSADAAGRLDSAKVGQLQLAVAQLGSVGTVSPANLIDVTPLAPQHTVAGYRHAAGELAARIATAKRQTTDTNELANELKRSVDSVNSALIGLAQATLASDATTPPRSGQGQAASNTLFTALSLIQPDGPKSSLMVRYATPSEAENLISALDWYLESN